jgi:hypothetical protein
VVLLRLARRGIGPCCFADGTGFSWRTAIPGFETGLLRGELSVAGALVQLDSFSGEGGRWTGFPFLWTSGDGNRGEYVDGNVGFPAVPGLTVDAWPLWCSFA